MTPELEALAGQEARVFYIVDVRSEFRRNRYITLWRPEDAGYAYPLPWAGKYSRDRIDANPGYYHKHRYGTAPAFDRFPVPCEIVERFAVSPEPGRIDGNAGPAIPNTPAVRAALRRARYMPAGLRALRASTPTQNHKGPYDE